MGSGAGIAQDALPVFLATDSYGKHFRKYRDLMRVVGELLRRQPMGETPRGPACRVQLLPDHPSDGLTTIAGEPLHDMINARKCVSPQANDAVDFLYDHSDLLCRLSARFGCPRIAKGPAQRAAYTVRTARELAPLTFAHFANALQNQQHSSAKAALSTLDAAYLVARFGGEGLVCHPPGSAFEPLVLELEKAALTDLPWKFPAAPQQARPAVAACALTTATPRKVERGVSEGRFSIRCSAPKPPS